MDLEKMVSTITLDPEQRVAGDYVKKAIFENKILRLKTDIKLIEMETKNTTDELKSDMESLRKINRYLLLLIVIFEACLVIALR